MNLKYIKEVMKNEGTVFTMITLRVLPKTRDYLNEKARAQKVSTAEYIKQRLGIQTIRIINKENASKIDNTIETIYEI